MVEGTKPLIQARYPSAYESILTDEPSCRWSRATMLGTAGSIVFSSERLVAVWAFGEVRASLRGNVLDAELLGLRIVDYDLIIVLTSCY